MFGKNIVIQPGNFYLGGVRKTQTIWIQTAIKSPTSPCKCCIDLTCPWETFTIFIGLLTGVRELSKFWLMTCKIVVIIPSFPFCSQWIGGVWGFWCLSCWREHLRLLWKEREIPRVRCPSESRPHTAKPPVIPMILHTSIYTLCLSSPWYCYDCIL